MFKKDYFVVNKDGVSPFQNMAAYLGGSAFQTVMDNPVRFERGSSIYISRTTVYYVWLRVLLRLGRSLKTITINQFPQ
ncbi:hypothetical protein OAV88_01555 [bacterium]|nr:hypothetical protein [bacterium]